MLINAGISTVVYLSGYPDELGKEMLAEASIMTRQFEGASITLKDNP